jgi:hypothetical protein
MKFKKIFFAAYLLCCNAAFAQLTINAGSQLKIAGNVSVVLANTSLVNNGNCNNTTGRFIFTGTAPNTISGSNVIQMQELEIAKAGGAVLSLQQHLGVGGKIVFTSSNIDITNYNIDLATTGMLEGETELSRITASANGQVWSSAVLNAPSGENPGNVGAMITSAQNLGTVVIKRGHRSQTNVYGNGSSILRYYDISPGNNTALNATLRFHYFDAELNSLPEANLALWRSTNNQQWTNEMFTSKDASANWVEKNNISSFSRWTLSTIFNPLPVQLLRWNGSSVNCKAELIWETASEQSSSHFEIEHSQDGLTFTKVAEVTAAGNSTTLQRYRYSMAIAQGDHQFRLRMVDKDGHFRLSSMLHLRSECTSDSYVLYPNPVQSSFRITGVQKGQQLVLSTASGQVVKTWQDVPAAGFNVSSLPAGTYNVQIFQSNVLVWSGSLLKK